MIKFLHKLLQNTEMIAALKINIIKTAIIIFPLLSIASFHAGIPIIALLILSLIGLFTGKYRIRIDKSEMIFLSLFFLYFLVVLINVIYFSGDFRDLDTPSRFALVIPIYFLFKNEELNNQWIIYGLIIGSIFTGIYSFADVFIYQIHHLDNAGIISFYSSILGLSCLSLISDANSKKINQILLISSILGFLGSFLSGGRGVWISAVICLGIIFFINPMKLKVKEFFKFVSLIILVFILAIFIDNHRIGIDRLDSGEVVFTPSTTGMLNKIKETAGVVNYIEQEIQNSSNENIINQQVYSSSGQRLEMWKAASIIIKDNPIFGVGEGNFNEETKLLIKENIISPNIDYYTHPHNEYLSALVEQGLIGFVLLLFIYFLPLRYFLSELKKSQSRQKKHVSLVGAIILIHYIFYSFTSGVFDHQTTTLFFSFMLILLFAQAKKIESLK